MMGSLVLFCMHYNLMYRLGCPHCLQQAMKRRPCHAYLAADLEAVRFMHLIWPEHLMPLTTTCTPCASAVRFQHNMQLTLLSTCPIALQRTMAELPAQKRARYLHLGLPPADVTVLADDLETTRLFDAVLATGVTPKVAANWLMGDIMAYCKVGR